MACVTRCPRKNAPGLVIMALRSLSQEEGFFTDSEKGRQQLALKRTVGENILKRGYCVSPHIVTFEDHPETGPVWKWERENMYDVFERLGANLDGDGPGAMRKIPQESLDELDRIFEVTGGKARFDKIEEASAAKARELGMSDEEVEKMAWLGISGIANVLCCIKMAKYYELTENDVVGTVLTDSAVMYQSRIEELNQMYGAYNAHEASLDHNLHMLGLKTDSMLELTYTERKRVHNLKYYTWVEQQGMDVEDLNAQWYDTKNTWDAVHAQAKELDQLICEFNEATGLLKAL